MKVNVWDCSAYLVLHGFNTTDSQSRFKAEEWGWLSDRGIVYSDYAVVCRYTHTYWFTHIFAAEPNTFHYFHNALYGFCQSQWSRIQRVPPNSTITQSVCPCPLRDTSKCDVTPLPTGPHRLSVLNTLVKIWFILVWATITTFVGELHHHWFH